MTATIIDQARLILGDDETAFVELRARHPHLGQVKQRWYGLGQLDALERSAATLSQSYDVWLGAARRSERGGKADHVRSSLCVWADCDSPDAVAALRAFRPVPTLVVRSSSGHLHAWWALDHVLDGDDIKPALRRLAAALGSDRGVCDRAHVLRAIGTTNHKRERPERVEAVHFTRKTYAIDTVLASTPIDVPSVNGAGTGEAEPRARVAPGGMREHLLDLAVRCARSGMLDAAAIGRVLCVEFDAVRVPGATYQDDESDALEIAQWAAGSNIARRERERQREMVGAPGAPNESGPTGRYDGRVIDLRAALAEPDTPIPWRCESLVADGFLTVLAGRGGEGKSWLALTLACGVARGGAAAGISCMKGKALLFDAENGPRLMIRRFRAADVTADTGIQPVNAGGLRVTTDLKWFRQVIEDEQANLVVFDSLRVLSSGSKESDGDEMEPIVTALKELARTTGAGVLLIHHRGKAESSDYRGSSVILDQTDLLFTLGRATGDPDGRHRRQITTIKCRIEEEPPPRWVRIETRGFGRVYVDEAEPFEAEDTPRPRDEHRDAALDLLGGIPRSGRNIAKHLDVSEATVRRLLHDLEAEGIAEKTTDGWVRHCVTSLGGDARDAPPVTPDAEPDLGASPPVTHRDAPVTHDAPNTNGYHPVCSCATPADALDDRRCSRCYGRHPELVR